MAKQIMRPQMQPKVIDDFVERSFIKLKQLYPDFLVVGLAERDKTLNWQLERLARRLGYAELADLLRQCGFDLPADSQNLILHPIPQSEATEQSETPPASAALQSALDKLAQLYPEHKIFALEHTLYTISLYNHLFLPQNQWFILKFQTEQLQVISW